jgi:hypothetical protein
MQHSRAVAVATAAGSLLLIVACGRDTGAPNSDDVPASVAGDEVAVRVENDGSTIAGPAPWPLVVSVYGDGRVVTQHRQPETFPLPALPGRQLQRISTENVHRLVQRAIDAGVAGRPDVGGYGRSDSSTTRLTVTTVDGPKSLTVYDLQYEPGNGNRSGLTKTQLAARAPLQDLYSALTNLRAALGPDAVSAAAPYVAHTVMATVSPWSKPRTNAGENPEIAWPGPELPGQPLTSRPELGCVVVTGDAASAVMAAASKATSSTPWTAGGKRWTVHLHPLLPDEKPCPLGQAARTCGPCPD